jgi:hypothetical protein
VGPLSLLALLAELGKFPAMLLCVIYVSASSPFIITITSHGYKERYAEA